MAGGNHSHRNYGSGPPCCAHRLQMHARPRCSAGTRSSNSGLKLACVHQHGDSSPPGAAMAQALACPHSGHRAGSTSGVFMGSGHYSMAVGVKSAQAPGEQFSGVQDTATALDCTQPRPIARDR